MMKKALMASFTAILCAAVLLLCLKRVDVSTVAEPSSVRYPKITVDAGHGGFDGGAVAPDGTLEKDLNLDIARVLGWLLTLRGFDVTMVRTEDGGLESGDESSIREKKVSDMHARLALYEAADMNIAVHQNMFGDTRYSGTQVFFSENHPLSKPMASAVRDAVYTTLQPDNTRELKAGSRDIYLLYKTTKPTVLVECGFLSHAAELEKLKTDAYQKQLASCMADGITQYAAKYVVKGEATV